MAFCFSSIQSRAARTQPSFSCTLKWEKVPSRTLISSSQGLLIAWADHCTANSILAITGKSNQSKCNSSEGIRVGLDIYMNKNSFCTLTCCDKNNKNLSFHAPGQKMVSEQGVRNKFPLTTVVPNCPGHSTGSRDVK